ncbi:MAG TPA: hypothetical protein VKG79_04115 [Bryobacteraceae bacterium]|nr:hypothetical protein [Bryobacteraceae bacterium]
MSARAGVLCILPLLAASVARAENDFTVYELLAPQTHKFAIVYDVATSEEGARFYLNPIRRGSKASDERVIDLATNQPLKFETVDAKAARESGLHGTVPDDSLFLKVYLAAPVPKTGQARIRIFKTYEDAPSYFAEGDRIVFDRPLGIKRNVVVLPAGYELIGSTVPAIVSIQPDGRVRVSMLNDRDDQLPVKIIGRKLK